VLIVLSGLPGTGKSRIADGIAHALGVSVFSVDPIESAIVQAGIPASFETGLAAYLVAEQLVGRNLTAGLDAVIDAVNSVDEARDMWRRLAEKHAVELRIIECVISDVALHRTRVEGRSRGLAFAEPTWDDVVRRRTEWTPWPEPHLTLDAGEPADANLAKALESIARLPT
jgi:predicted kinase